MGHADQASGHGEINRGMNQVKAQRHQQAGPRVFHVEFYAQRGSSVTHNSLSDSEDSDGRVAQHILRQADESPGKQSCNRAAARHGKKDRHEQRQIEIDREARETQWQKRLHKERKQRHANRYRDAEPVDLNLFP